MAARLIPAGLVLGALLGACSPAGAQITPTATPLPRNQLQQRYLAAAKTYNAGESAIQQAESQYCSPASATADLTHCETALSNDRQETIAFDRAVRAITFPASAGGLVAQLLSDDSKLENVLEQAAISPSLSAINALTPQILQLLTNASRDAVAVRSAIGLSSTSTPAA